MYRSWSKGCEGYLGCTGPGARDVRGTWGVQVLEQGMRGVPGVYMSWSKGCEGYLGCTSHGARDFVRGPRNGERIVEGQGPGPLGPRP